MTFYQYKTMVEDGKGKVTFLLAVSDSLEGLFDLSEGNEVHCFDMKEANVDLDVGSGEFAKDEFSFDLLYIPTKTSDIDKKAYYFTLESQNKNNKRNIAVFIEPTFEVNGTTLKSDNVVFMGQINTKMSAEDFRWYDLAYGNYINPDRNWKLKSFDFTTEVFDVELKEQIDFFVNRGDELSNGVGTNGDGQYGRDWTTNTAYANFIEWYNENVKDRLGYSLYDQEFYYYEDDSIVGLYPDSEGRKFSEVRYLHLCNFQDCLLEICRSVIERKQLTGLDIVIDNTSCTQNFNTVGVRGQIIEKANGEANQKGYYVKAQHMYWDGAEMETNNTTLPIKFGSGEDSFFISWTNFDPKEGDENYSFQQKGTLSSIITWIAACFGLYARFYYSNDGKLHIKFSNRQIISKDYVMIRDVEKAAINTESKFLRKEKQTFYGQTNQALAEKPTVKNNLSSFEITTVKQSLIEDRFREFVPSETTESNKFVSEKGANKTLLTIGLPLLKPENLYGDCATIYDWAESDGDPNTHYFEAGTGNIYSGNGGIDQNGKHYGFQKYLPFNAMLVRGLPTTDESFPTRILDGGFLDTQYWDYEEKLGWYANNLIYLKRTENKNLNGISKERDYYEPVISIDNPELDKNGTGQGTRFWSIAEMMNEYYKAHDEEYYQTEYTLTVPFLNGFKKSINGDSPLDETEVFKNLEIGSKFKTKEDRTNPATGITTTEVFEYLVIGIKRKFSYPETTIRLQLKDRFPFHGSIKNDGSFQSGFYTPPPVINELLNEVIIDFELTENWNDDIDNTIVTGTKFNEDGYEIGTLYYKDITHGLKLIENESLKVDISAVDKDDYNTSLFVWAEIIDNQTIRLFSIKRNENAVIPANVGTSGDIIGTMKLTKVVGKQNNQNNNILLRIGARNIS